MQAKEIMEPVTDNWLRPDMTLPEAVCKIQETKWGEANASVNGMVVLENGLRLIGVLSIKDVIRAVIPRYFDLDHNLEGFTWEGMLEEEVEKAHDLKVAEVMSSEVVTVHPEDSLMVCADQMIEHQIQRLPVVDKSGRVMGIVHIRDLYSCIAKLLGTFDK